MAIALASLWGVATLLFVLLGLLGDPAQQLAGQRADAATLANIRQELGLDRPRHIQYLLYLNDLSPLGYVPEGRQSGLALIPLSQGAIALKWPYLGRSFQNQQPVIQLYLQRLGATLLLASVAMTWASAWGVGLALLAAWLRHPWLEGILGAVAWLGVSVPSFFAATLAIWLLAVKWGAHTGLPISGYAWQEDLFSMGYSFQPAFVLLPMLTLGWRPAALLYQLLLGGLRQELASAYCLAARAQGLSPGRILLTHALPNALNPVLTAMGGWLASLLAGAFFVEYIFDWQGVGKLTVDALLQNDYPLLLACCLLTAGLFFVLTQLTDMALRWLDPRMD